MRLAYADPPYPGRAHLYADHPDYAGEVDHHALIERLRGFDGWALSTNAESLHWLLPLAPEARVLAWTKHTVTYSWEPVLVVPARQPHGVRDWIQCEPDSFQFRPRPDSYVIGRKPEAFCMWLFQWLGADPADDLDDVFPGSGAVGEAWQRWRSQPALPFITRGPSAQARMERRAGKKLLEAHPTLDVLTMNDPRRGVA